MRRFASLTALLAALPLAAIAAQSPTPPPFALIPLPRQATALDTMRLRRGFSIAAALSADDRFAAGDFSDEMHARGIAVSTAPVAGAVRVYLLRTGTPAAAAALHRADATFDPAMRAEGYVLRASRGRVDIVGATASGVFYGLQTLKQLVEGTGATARLLGARIRDWPAMQYRGFHDDLSRGPLPTLAFQQKQIRTFAAYKINVYSPYFEQSLAYASQPLIAPPGGAMSRADVRTLVAYAKQYHIDVIPEQEAFGHLHHVLKYELYSPLAETPHGHVLAPGQAGSIPLIAQMFAEIDSLFPSPFVHLGADETFELGRGQTADRVKAEGLGAVYIDFLRQIEARLRPSGKRFLFWGDVAGNSPDLVKTLPKDMIAVAWNYWSYDHFDPSLTPFSTAGMETWVAPGVSNWNRVYPDNDIALRNIQGFVRDGQRLGSTGVLNTSWDDDGEAIFNEVWYGVLFGAACSWQSGESSIDAFEHAYGRVFHGDTTGDIDAAQLHLMAAHVALDSAHVGDGSDGLFWLDPWTPEGMLTAQKIRPVTSALRIHAESALVLIARARAAGARDDDALAAMELGARRLDVIGMHFQFADEIVQMYARASDTTDAGETGRDLSDIASINGRAQDLRDAYGLTRELYEAAWRRENRPYWLDNVLARYDQAMQRWIDRIDRVLAARATWSRTKHLPPAADVGIPASMPGLP
jgi:hexosaminidase